MGEGGEILEQVCRQGQGWKLLVVSCCVARAGQTRKTCSRDFDLERQVATGELLVGLGEMFLSQKDLGSKMDHDVRQKLRPTHFPVRFVLDEHESFESHIDEIMFV